MGFLFLKYFFDLVSNKNWSPTRRLKSPQIAFCKLPNETYCILSAFSDESKLKPFFVLQQCYFTSFATENIAQLIVIVILHKTAENSIEKPVKTKKPAKTTKKSVNSKGQMPSLKQENPQQNFQPSIKKIVFQFEIKHVLTTTCTAATSLTSLTKIVSKKESIYQSH